MTDITSLWNIVPSFEMPISGLGTITLLDLVNKTTSSKSEARRLILQGGIYINEVRCTDPNRIITKDDLI